MEAATPYKAGKKGPKDLERGKTPAKSATLDDFSPEGAADEFDVALVSESRYIPFENLLKEFTHRHMWFV